MKYIYLLAIIAILISSAGCALINDTPSHTADEVINIAKGFSRDCYIQIEQPSHG